MKKILLVLILSHTFSSGYSIFGVKLEDKAIAIDSNNQCVVFDGKEKQCTIKDLSIILSYKQGWR